MPNPQTLTGSKKTSDSEEKVVQVRDLFLVEWTPEEWEKLKGLLVRVAQSSEQGSAQRDSTPPSAS